MGVFDLENSFINGSKPHDDNKGAYDKEYFSGMELGGNQG